MTDVMMDRITAAIHDQFDGGRERFAGLWEEIGETGDPLHRCVLAHSAADLEPDPHRSLVWNRRSLDALADLSDERLKTTFPTLSVAEFRPSLHLNLAQDYFELGRMIEAERALEAATADLPILPDVGYGAMIRRGIARLRGQVRAVLVVGLLAPAAILLDHRNGVATRQPSVEVAILAALGAERVVIAV